jgi:hypothetical protein
MLHHSCGISMACDTHTHTRLCRVRSCSFAVSVIPELEFLYLLKFKFIMHNTPEIAGLRTSLRKSHRTSRDVRTRNRTKHRTRHRTSTVIKPYATYGVPPSED